MLIQHSSLDWQVAQQLCSAACDYAVNTKLNICVWVLDNQGQPLSMMRTNHAPLLSTDIARDKAYTAVSFGFGTHLWEQQLADKPLIREGLSNRENMVLFGGGLAIKYGHELVGAIGVSGGSEEQDQKCARAAIAGFDCLSAH